MGFAAWVRVRRFLQPRRLGLPDRRAGSVNGLAARLYIWVVLLLVIGAVDEAFTVIYFMA